MFHKMCSFANNIHKIQRSVNFFQRYTCFNLILFYLQQIKREEEILLSLSHDQNQQRLFEYTPPIYDHQGPPIPDKSDLGQHG